MIADGTLVLIDITVKHKCGNYITLHGDTQDCIVGECITCGDDYEIDLQMDEDNDSDSGEEPIQSPPANTCATPTSVSPKDRSGRQSHRNGSSLAHSLPYRVFRRVNRRSRY